MRCGGYLLVDGSKDVMYSFGRFRGGPFLALPSSPSSSANKDVGCDRFVLFFWMVVVTEWSFSFDRNEKDNGWLCR